MAITRTEELKKKLEDEKEKYYKGEKVEAHPKKKKTQVKLMGAGTPYLMAGVVWFLMALMLPVYKLGTVIIISLFSWAVGAILSSIRKRQLRKLPPKKEKKTYKVDIAAKLYSLSDLVIDRAEVIRKKEIRETLASIAVSLSRMAEEVENDPKDRNKVRKLANYYGDMLLGLVDRYIALQANNLSEGEGVVNSSIDKIEHALSGADTAIKRMLDNMFTDDAMEINAEVKTLDNLMKLELDSEKINRKPNIEKTPEQMLDDSIAELKDNLKEEDNDGR